MEIRNEATAIRCLAVQRYASTQRGWFSALDVVRGTELPYNTVLPWLRGLVAAGFLESRMDRPPSRAPGSGWRYRVLERVKPVRRKM